MGYELHITRREHWADTEPSDITLNEWLTYVNGDKELELTNGYCIKIGSQTHFQDRPGYCEWNAHPIHIEPKMRPWFAYWKGIIDTKNPDALTIRKMMQIAFSLNAKVQGDEGEVYTEDYLAEMLLEEEQLHSPQSNRQETLAEILVRCAQQ